MLPIQIVQPAKDREHGVRRIVRLLSEIGCACTVSQAGELYERMKPLDRTDRIVVARLSELIEIDWSKTNQEVAAVVADLARRWERPESENRDLVERRVWVVTNGLPAHPGPTFDGACMCDACRSMQGEDLSQENHGGAK